MENGISPINASVAGRPRRWTLAGYNHMARKFIPNSDINLKSLAVKTWDVAPGSTLYCPPAFFLPNQLERVTGWEEKRFFPFEHPGRTMRGVGNIQEPPTRAYLFKDVWLVDGGLYKNSASYWLSLKPRFFPRIFVDTEIERAAAYCTRNGGTWFGTWLMEDCVTYSLACNEGVPITTAPSNRYPMFPQMPDYEDWLGMRPVRLHTAFFHELVIFDDLSNNHSRQQRYRAMGEKLLSHVSSSAQPGVFILRGSSGELRFLRNELEIAEHLRKSRGFRIIDPSTADVSTIVAACAGAKVVVGVEGSQLVHGVNVLQPGGSLLALQPPSRFVSYYKYMMDLGESNFGFVVGIPEGDGFRVDIQEVERTLDLFPA